MKLSVGLLIDLGNSETRVKVLSGKNGYHFNMPNEYASLPQGYSVNERYTRNNSTVFQYGDSYIANGLLVDNEFRTQKMKPTSLERKTEQIVTMYTINLAIIRTLSILASENRVPVQNLNVTFNISLLLPPLEHEVLEQRLEEQVRTITSVNAYIPTMFQSTFKIDEVNIYSEAVAAFFGAFYREEGTLQSPISELTYNEEGNYYVSDNGSHISLTEVEQNKKFEEGYVLVLDIGAGTTDLALFKDMELIESSKETFKRGGNSVESWLAREIKLQFGYKPTSFERIVREGILQEGSTEHDVSALVTMCKDRYSRETVADLKEYLVGQSLDVQNLKGLLVAGGGSLASVRFVDGQPHVVSPAMGDVLMHYVQQLAPRTELLVTHGKDLRLLNLEGLNVLHKYA